MRQRIITAILALLVFIPFVVIGGYPLDVLMMILGVMTLHELLVMMNIKGHSLEGLVANVMVLGIIISHWYIDFFPLSVDIMFLFYVCLLALFTLMVYFPKRINIKNIGELMVSAIYVGFGYHYLIETRQMGLPAIIYVLVIIFTNDSFAYIVGRKLGKRKLAPTISPNKSIEGSIGGIFCSVIASTLMIHFSYFNHVLPFSLIQNLILTVLLAILGQYGDLYESAIKRYFGVKDSGWLLPGHGGLLDRFDNMLIVLPMFHFIISFFK